MQPRLWTYSAVDMHYFQLRNGMHWFNSNRRLSLKCHCPGFLAFQCGCGWVLGPRGAGTWVLLGISSKLWLDLNVTWAIGIKAHTAEERGVSWEQQSPKTRLGIVNATF